MSGRTKAIKRNATKKQQSLIEELEKGEATTTAIRNAGYKSQNKKQTMTSPVIQKALENIHKNTRQLTSIERADVLEGVLSAIQLAESLDDPATMIRGWNEIARLHGYHAAEKRELSVSGQVSHDHSGDLRLEQMSTKQLLELSNKENAIDITPEDYKVTERGDENSGSNEPEDLFDPTDEDDANTD